MPHQLGAALVPKGVQRPDELPSPALRKVVVVHGLQLQKAFHPKVVVVILGVLLLAAQMRCFNCNCLHFWLNVNLFCTILYLIFLLLNRIDTRLMHLKMSITAAC